MTDISRPVPLSTSDPLTIESWIFEARGRTLEAFATTFRPKPVLPPLIELREGRTYKHRPRKAKK